MTGERVYPIHDGVYQWLQLRISQKLSVNIEKATTIFQFPLVSNFQFTKISRCGLHNYIPAIHLR